MPAKNATKSYVENGFYHIYNRGVDKREIFADNQDYQVFTAYLEEYLSDRDEARLNKMLFSSSLPALKRARILRKLQLNNFFQDISLLAYCLMPNHFHLFLQQKGAQSIDRFMSSLSTRYATYFNRKYKRSGALFQGVYKAALITDEAHFLHISRYIHRQALDDGKADEQRYPSSYPEYLGLRRTPWLHPEEILAYFSVENPDYTYARFVAESIQPDQQDIALDFPDIA